MANGGEDSKDDASKSPLRGGRVAQFVLVGSFLLLCWLLMQAVHELGHVLGAWLVGGTVTQVVLHPLAISRTDVEPNPSPLFVVWAGPAIGVILPLLTWRAAAAAGIRAAYLFRFFAGFCLVANGGYVGSGVVAPVGDAAEMLRLYGATWPLALFGALTVPAGLALWHGQGRLFGLRGHREVEKRDAIACAVLLAGVVACELAVSSRL